MIINRKLESKNSKNFIPPGECPIRSILSRLGDKWSILVLVSLEANGTMRFGDLHRVIADISQRMLTVTLRSLEADGLVSRKVYPEIPPRVEYSLTETGLGLMPHLDGLVMWAEKNMPAILEKRREGETSLS